MFNRYYRYLVLLLFLPSVCFGGVSLDWYSTASGGSSCTNISQTVHDDYWTVTDNTCQKIKYQANCEFQTVTWRLYQNGGNVNAHIEARTANDGTGTQIGDSSDVTVVTTTDANGAVYTFTWSGSSPTPAADFYLCIVEDGLGGDLFTRSNTDNTSYEDANYSLWRSGSDLNQDAAFGITYK